jgi:hypothetical protein
MTPNMYNENIFYDVFNDFCVINICVLFYEFGQT